MSFLNFASNKFFDDDDFAYSAVAKSRIEYEKRDTNRYHMPVDVIETPTNYVVICDVPGIPKDRITVQVKDDKICIEGKRKKKIVSENDKYLMTERLNGPFKRIINVPSNCDANQMAAKIEEGMLVLTMPRINSTDVKVISVE